VTRGVALALGIGIVIGIAAALGLSALGTAASSFAPIQSYDVLDMVKRSF
jgi:hypothetical protein